MKLLRYGPAGQEKPGFLDEAGSIRALSGFAEGHDLLLPETQRRLRHTDPAAFPLVEGEQRIGCCVTNVGHFVAIGVNYVGHAEETGTPIPAEPLIFSKAPSCLAGPNDTIPVPPGSTKLDWEVELAIVIGTPAYNIEPEQSMSHIAGFCTSNDVSEREFQANRGGQFIKGKSSPGFGPLGPWLVTPDEIPNPQNLRLWLDVNDRRMQESSTADMIFGVSFLVSYVSRFMRLQTGDVITTGTPAGVGAGMKPQRFLAVGDVVTLGVEGLGEQRLTIGAPLS